MSTPVDGSYDVILVNGPGLLGLLTALRLVTQRKHLRLAVLDDPNQPAAIIDPYVILSEHKASLDLLEKLKLLPPWAAGGPSVFIETTPPPAPEGTQSPANIETVLDAARVDQLATALRARLESVFGVSFVSCRVLSITNDGAKSTLRTLYYGKDERLIRFSCHTSLRLCDAQYAGTIDVRPPLPTGDSLSLAIAAPRVAAMRLCLTFVALPGPWKSADLADFTVVYSTHPTIRRLHHRYDASEHSFEVIVAGVAALECLQRKGSCEDRKAYIIGELVELMSRNLVASSKEDDTNGNSGVFLRLRAGEPWKCTADAADADWDDCDQRPTALTERLLSLSSMGYTETLCCLEALPASSLAADAFLCRGLGGASDEPTTCEAVRSLEQLLQKADAMSSGVLSDDQTISIEKERKLREQPSLSLCVVMFIVLSVGLVCIVQGLWQGAVVLYQVYLRDMIYGSNSPQMMSSCDASANALKYL